MRTFIGIDIQVKIIIVIFIFPWNRSWHFETYFAYSFQMLCLFVLRFNVFLTLFQSHCDGISMRLLESPYRRHLTEAPRPVPIQPSSPLHTTLHSYVTSSAKRYLIAETNRQTDWRQRRDSLVSPLNTAGDTKSIEMYVKDLWRFHGFFAYLLIAYNYAQESQIWIYMVPKCLYNICFFIKRVKKMSKKYIHICIFALLKRSRVKSSEE